MNPLKHTSLKYLFLPFFMLCFSYQSVSQYGTVIYQRSYNSETDTTRTMFLKFSNKVAHLEEHSSGITQLMDFSGKTVVEFMQFDEKWYQTRTDFTQLPQPQFLSDTLTILGYSCRKAQFSYFSNTIEVWYTAAAPIFGSPIKEYLIDDCLVLKLVFNGNFTFLATGINLDKPVITGLPPDSALEITKARARELQINSRFVQVPVFHHQQINFVDSIINPPFDKPDAVFRLSHGTVVMKKVRLPEIARQGASVFARVSTFSNGDAYDRTCSLFTLSSTKHKTILDALKNGLEELPVFTDNQSGVYQGFVATDTYSPPVELMRFFTSFGAKHFNNLRPINNYIWADSVVYKQEITSLIPNDEEEIWIGVFIGNYDLGGHFLNLDLQFYPAWEPVEPPKKFILPLFNTVNIMEMSGQNYGRFFNNDTLVVDFEINDSLSQANLVFTTTGHGGWGGGDEFNPKLNQLFLDGEQIFNHTPWRTDCGSYRLLNPASGNFENGLSSSDLSRSNWCPGTVTNPFFIPLKDLNPGQHQIRVVINQGSDEGGSFSAWCVSGTIIANIPNP